MQLDFLLAELEGLARHGRRAADERHPRHAQDFGVKAHALRFVGGGENQVVEMADHGDAYLAGAASRASARPRRLR
ncbi:hypothetical protein D3C71_1811530 [compost metagenome]